MNSICWSLHSPYVWSLSPTPRLCTSAVTRESPAWGSPSAPRPRACGLLLGWSQVLHSALWPGPWSPKPACGLLGPVVLGFISLSSLARLSVLHANPCDRPHSDTSPGSEKKAWPQPWSYSGSRWREAGGAGPDPERSRSLTPTAAGKVKRRQQRSTGPASVSCRNPRARDSSGPRIPGTEETQELLQALSCLSLMQAATLRHPRRLVLQAPSQ